MKPIFDELIPPMMQTFAVDLIAEIISSERDNQIAIARKLGKEKDWIRRCIDFEVKNHEFRSPHIHEMACVYIYFERSDYDGNQTMSKLPSTNQLVIEAYAYGDNKLNDKCSVEMSADVIADVRLDYLVAQLKQIMMSEAAENIRIKSGISSTILKSTERIFYPEKENMAQSAIGQKIIFELEFDEKTKYLTGTQIKELYIQNHIRDAIVSVLITDS